MSSENTKTPVSRRSFLKRSSAIAVAASIAPNLDLLPKTKAAEPSSYTNFRFTPFTRPLPIPSRLASTVLDPKPGTVEASVGSAKVYHGIAPEYSPTHPTHSADWHRKAERQHRMAYQSCLHEWLPGVQTPCFGYNGLVPGPTIRARFGEPLVIRATNLLDVEASIHLHGAHSPAHADGHPCFYIFPGESRDYYYPNIVPKHDNGTFDYNESPSTMWYHDHGNDVTAHNVAHGLAGFCLFTDDVEENLIANRILPAVDNPDGTQGNYDIPVAFSDQRLNPDGTLYWDPFDHDGRIGDIFGANGVAQPFMNVERRKYRFRFLCASLARVYQLRLSTGQPMLQIGNDSWLLPNAISVNSLYLNPARRADVIIDFANYPAGTELYLENIMQQTNGRKPDGIDTKNPIRMIKFIVGGNKVTNDIRIMAGTPLRPHTNLVESEATVTRTFDFNRSQGAWQINGQFYSAYRADADIKRGATEKWILRNKSGGWWHPIHIHLESHQVLRINGQTPPPHLRFKSDHSQLEDNTTIELLMRFRTFDGPFVFHCHNNNHEDMRMMKQVEVRKQNLVNGTMAPSMFSGTKWTVPPAVCGIPQADINNHPGLFS